MGLDKDLNREGLKKMPVCVVAKGPPRRNKGKMGLIVFLFCYWVVILNLMFAKP
ncbi:unnamed protein product [Prunus brigantina]